jgi:hypothetical protein
MDPVDANSKEEAVGMMMQHMADNPDWVQKHMAEKHAGQPAPSMEEQKASLMATAVEI